MKFVKAVFVSKIENEEFVFVCFPCRQNLTELWWAHAVVVQRTEEVSVQIEKRATRAARLFSSFITNDIIFFGGVRRYF